MEIDGSEDFVLTKELTLVEVMVEPVTLPVDVEDVIEILLVCGVGVSEAIAVGKVEAVGISLEISISMELTRGNEVRDELFW